MNSSADFEKPAAHNDNEVSRCRTSQDTIAEVDEAIFAGKDDSVVSKEVEEKKNIDYQFNEQVSAIKEIAIK